MLEPNRSQRGTEKVLTICDECQLERLVLELGDSLRSRIIIREDDKGIRLLRRIDHVFAIRIKRFEQGLQLFGRHSADNAAICRENYLQFSILGVDIIPHVNV